MESLCSDYIGALMGYISAEYDNIPDEVTPEMHEFFLECFHQGLCLPNAAGLFWESFLRRLGNL